MYLAIDVGGSKTLLATFSQDGELKESNKFETPETYPEFISTLADNVAKLATKDFKAVVAAVPAKLNRSEGIAIAFGNLNWTNVPIGPDIEKLLHTPVVIENDAKLAALSEAILVKDTYNKVLYVTISTGIGGGYVVHGKLDPNLIDMEVGQLLLEHEGKLMDWEDFASGKAFSRRFGKLVSEVPVDNTEAWYWFARNIAVGLVDLIATLTPDAIIIGGGAGAHLEKFQARLEEELKIYENPLFIIPPLQKAQRAEEAVIYGCYELIRQVYGKAHR